MLTIPFILVVPDDLRLYLLELQISSRAIDIVPSCFVANKVGWVLFFICAYIRLFPGPSAWLDELGYLR